eukprot:TRINITY_DN1254_c0_g1_i1.p1 TRINITY_DN1254_c0_g1~~TRINITY_DN1254_c0_g1_i1.p1  ORF type:complete len:324 (-),score=50.68 TRINITY_DN1254_c0_g1_i1:205-1176(-)
MACPTALQQLPFTDLPGHILENIISCMSLTSLGRLEVCHRTLAPYCEKAPQWALGVAAFDTVNMTAGGEDESFKVVIIPFMEALHAFDPRMGTVHSTLSPRQQFHELMQFHAKCTGNLLAALGQYMPLAHIEEGSWDRFALFKANTTHHPSDVWPWEDPRVEALAALEAADSGRYHHFLDLIFLSSAREDLARGPLEFAQVFAGAPFPPVEKKRLVFPDLTEAEAAAAALPFEHLWYSRSSQQEWDAFYISRVIENLDGHFKARGVDGLWRDHKLPDLVLGSERHMERLLEPVGPAVLFGDALVEWLDCVAACKHLCSEGACE